MKFNNSRAIIKHNTNTNVKHSVGGLLPMRLTRNTTQRLDQTDNNQIIRRLEKPTEKTMKWGEPIWFLFHTLAEKIKDEHFQAKKYELITLIRSINRRHCYTLGACLWKSNITYLLPFLFISCQSCMYTNI